MNILRRLPTNRLLGLLAAALVLAGSVTAVAVAALGGGGPVPNPKPLATAVHDALAAPHIAGVTATIEFTNALIDSSSVQTRSPLLQGATGRLWASSDGHLRIELQSTRGDTQILLAPGSFSLYDTASNTVYEGTLPAQHGTQETHQPPSVQTIQSYIGRLMQQVDVSGAIPGDIAGEPAYTVQITPRHSGGLLGSAQLAWDALKGVPLRVAIYAAGKPNPVLQLKVTSISFGPVPASNFSVTPAAGAKVVRIAQPSAQPAAHTSHGRRSVVTGAAAVAAALPFRLDAPNALAGLPRTSVKLLDWGNDKAALVTYGQHLGAIVVVERAATASTGTHEGSLLGSLPTIQINGASGSELATALGTILTFQRADVSYIVAGSVPPAAAEAAARGL